MLTSLPVARLNSDQIALETDRDDRTKLYCHICETSFKKTGKSRHLSGKAHRDNVEIAKENTIPHPAMSTVPQGARPLQFVPLLDPGSPLLLSESSDEEPSDRTQFFQDFMVDPRDGTYIDRNGEAIWFSAGDNPEQRQETLKQKVHDQFKQLTLMQGHTVFGSFEGNLDDDNLCRDANDVLEDPVGQLSDAIELLSM